MPVLQVFPVFRLSMNDRRKMQTALICVTAAAVLIRLLYAIPGIMNPELVMRIDSATYLGPALSLLHDGTYSTAAGSGVPALVRTPLYPLYLAGLLGISGHSLGFCVFVSALLGGLITVPLFLSARLYASWKAALAAAVLFALNPTAIAVAPMFISDTLFCFVLAFQIFFFLKFIRTRRLVFLLVSAAAAALALLVRPLNLFWIIPCLFVVWCIREIPWREKLRGSLLSLLLFLCILSPWVIRNHHHGAGWRIDAVSADTALHNRSALESRLTGIPGEELRNRYRADGEAEFKAHPEKYKTPSARFSYFEGKLAEIIKAHPFRYLALHVRPVVLIPDAASFFENLGLTQTGRGTWDVINRHGIIAGVRHYFNGNYLLPCLLAPLLLAAALTYLLAFYTLFRAFLKKDWMMILLFLLLAEYYLFMTGPVAMPRYQLAALPFLCVMAACAADRILSRTFNGADSGPLSPKDSVMASAPVKNP